MRLCSCVALHIRLVSSVLHIWRQLDADFVLPSNGGSTPTQWNHCIASATFDLTIIGIGGAGDDDGSGGGG